MVAKSLYRSVDLINSVNKAIVTNQLMRTKDSILLSISGGQDSICLLVLFNLFCTQMELDLNLLWCHHLWQFDSFSLMRQVTKLSFLFQFNGCFAITSTFVPSELLARNWRQNCSYRLSFFYNCYKIILAHSASDKAETILLNFLRGTGLTGLSPLHWTKIIDEKSFRKGFGTNLCFGSIGCVECEAKHPKQPISEKHLSQVVPSISSFPLAQQPVPCFYWLSFHLVPFIKPKKDDKEERIPDSLFYLAAFFRAKQKRSTSLLRTPFFCLFRNHQYFVSFACTPVACLPPFRLVFCSWDNMAQAKVFCVGQIVNKGCRKDVKKLEKHELSLRKQSLFCFALRALHGASSMQRCTKEGFFFTYFPLSERFFVSSIFTCGACICFASKMHNLLLCVRSKEDATYIPKVQSREDASASKISSLFFFVHKIDNTNITSKHFVEKLKKTSFFMFNPLRFIEHLHYCYSLLAAPFLASTVASAKPAHEIYFFSALWYVPLHMQLCVLCPVLCIFFAPTVHAYPVSLEERAKDTKEGTSCMCTVQIKANQHVMLEARRDERSLFPLLQNFVPWWLDKAFFKKHLSSFEKKKTKVPFKFADEKIAKYSKKVTNKKWFHLVSYAFFKVCFTSLERSKQYSQKSRFQKGKGLNNLQVNQMPFLYTQLKIKIPQDTF